MRFRRRQLSLTALIVVGSLTIASCGGGDDGADDAGVDDGPEASDDSGEDTADGATTDRSVSDEDASGDGTLTGEDDGVEDTGGGATGEDASGSSEQLVFECPEGDRGGELTITTFAPTNTVSPYVLFGTGAVGGDYAAAIYDTIWRYDANTDTYSPRMGESLTDDSGDATVWTLTLREGVTFGNGNDLTTEDVQAHIERLQQTAIRASGMSNLVESMEIVDDRTMTLTLSSPFNMEYFFATEPGWVPDADAVAAAPVIDDTSQFGLDMESAVGAGAGPFEVERVVPGEEIVLSSKDSYWGGRACADMLTFRFIADEEARIESYDLGEIDVMFVDSNRQAAFTNDLGDLYWPGATGGLDYVAPDQGLASDGAETKWNDIRLREALQLAVDYDVINERIFEGLPPRTTSALVPEESPLWYDVHGPPYDPERASALVAEAAADGVETSFTYLYEEPESQMALTLEAMWEAVGFDVTIEVVPSALGRIIERNFDVAGSGYAVQPPAPWTTLNGLECGNPRQRTGFCDEDMDAALAQLRGAQDTEQTMEALVAVQEVWNRTFPAVIVNHSVWGSAKQDWVGEIPMGPDSNPYFHLVTVSE